MIIPIILDSYTTSKKDEVECSIRLISEEVLGDAQLLKEFKIADGVKFSLSLSKGMDTLDKKNGELIQDSVQADDSDFLAALRLASHKLDKMADEAWAEFDAGNAKILP